MYVCSVDQKFKMYASLMKLRTHIEKNEETEVSLTSFFCLFVKILGWRPWVTWWRRRPSPGSCPTSLTTKRGDR